ncbi:sentrin-specific protease 7b isoform 2-T2 [Aulostomus maculatus]
MAAPFKIPKKKQRAGSDSTHLQMQSPLSRLQSPAPKNTVQFGGQPGGGETGRMHAGSSLSSMPSSHSSPFQPLFKNMVRTLLGLREASAVSPRAAGGWARPPQQGQRWRLKRGSDRLLLPDRTSECPSPPQKKSDPRGVTPPSESISEESGDSLAKLRADEHPGSLSSSPGWRTWRSTLQGERNSPGAVAQQKNFSGVASEDDFVTASRTNSSPTQRHPASSESSLLSIGTTPFGGRSLCALSCRTACRKQREKESEGKRARRAGVLHLRRRAANQSEPIVLSSEEDEDEEGDARTLPSQVVGQRPQNPDTAEVHHLDENSPPSFLELEFTSLEAGLTHADAHGKMMISPYAISLPLKGGQGGEDGEVTLVASQVHGYGVWNGVVARGGALLAGWEGPAPSLLLLCVSNAQANLIQRELTAIQPGAKTGPSCSVLLVLLKERLQEIQAALLASLLDMEEFRKGRSASSGVPASPLNWTDGLLLLRCCAPPLDQHLLDLLGHSAEASGQVRCSQQNKTPSGLRQLPSRLVQYPPPPCKGRITITKEDLACLEAGEFLNDVIIDFYLKFLLQEGVAGAVAQQSHVFSSFFYKQLSRQQVAGEDGEAAIVPDRKMRHQRVKTWTRHVDIFTKDFLFVPVNQEAHWFLALVCFPGLEDVQYQERPGRSERTASLRSTQPPDCTQQGCNRDATLKRPCILIMDSLKSSRHNNVCRLLRDYLQVEWQVRRGRQRLFTADSMRHCSCSVPQQDNSSDCGLYLLQYVESFLQNPVVHFTLPPHLENWFPQQHVRQKREDIRRLIMRLHESQMTR